MNAVSSVPRTIHTVWLGDRMPALVQRCHERATQMHHGTQWTMRLWRDADVTRENFPIVYDAVCKAESPAQRVDLLRLELLYQHGGGWYVDSDVHFISSLEHLYATHSEEGDSSSSSSSEGSSAGRRSSNGSETKDNDVVVVCHENDADPYAVGMMSTAVIGATPRHPLMALAAREAACAPLNTPNINETTGPFLFGRCLRQYQCQCHCRSIVRLPSATFYPYLWDVPSEEIVRRVSSAAEGNGKDVATTVAAHLWLASWK